MEDVYKWEGISLEVTSDIRMKELRPLQDLFKLSLELFSGLISKCLFNIYGRVNKTSIREAFLCEELRGVGAAAVFSFLLPLGR